jgi:hypothetical protein
MTTYLGKSKTCLGPTPIFRGRFAFKGVKEEFNCTVESEKYFEDNRAGVVTATRAGLVNRWRRKNADP